MGPANGNTAITVHGSDQTMDIFSALLDRFLEKDKKDKKTFTSTAAKLDWLRSQIIGQYAEYQTPYGRRLLTYADHTASGRALRFIENFIMETVLPVYGNTHTDDSFVGGMTSNIVEQSAKYVKACMGAGEDDALLFCGSGSTAAIKKLQECIGVSVSPLLRDDILSAMNDEYRWVVFVGPMEHHSNLLSWRNSLAEVVEVPLSDTGLVDITYLRAALQDPMYKNRPKLGSFSAGSNVTGILSGTRKIAKILHAYGAFACFDFAACAPYVKIEMRSGEEDGYDAIYISPHKFMGGPGTSGLLLMSKDLYLLRDGPPSTCGGGTVDFVNFEEENTLYVDEIEHREDAGTPAIVQKVRTALCYCVKEFLSAELIASRETFFIEKALARLGANPYIDLYGNTTAKRIAIISFGISPPVDAGVHVDQHTAATDDDTPGNSFRHSVGSDSSFEAVALQWRPKGSPLDNKISFPQKKRVSIFANPFKQANSSSGQRPPRLQRQESKNHIPKERVTAPTERARGKPLNSRFIVKLLSDLFGIQARGGCSCAAVYGHQLLGVDNDGSLLFRDAVNRGYNAIKPGWARLSFGYYISHDEFDFILSCIEFITEYGARFVQLYDLDWTSGDWKFKQDNQEVLDLIADAEKQVFGDQRIVPWSKGRPQSPLPARPVSPLPGRPQSPLPARFSSLISPKILPITTPSFNTDESNSSQQFPQYLKMATYIAERLPRHTSDSRPSPEDLDPYLLPFVF